MFTSSSEAIASVAESANFAQAPAISPTANRRPPGLPVRLSRDENALAELLRHPGISRRGSASRIAANVQPTGIAELDMRLPGGGWPQGALSEILIEHDGIGECSLVLPALAALTQARKRVVFVAPPYIPYAPALVAAGIDLAQIVHIDASAADTHWTAEQCLRAGCCGAVLNWLPDADYRQLRRLQLAAETGASLAFVFRPLRAAQQTSPAALRLQVTTSESRSRIDIIKCRARIGETGQAIQIRA
jgi:hypothetical protein